MGGRGTGGDGREGKGGRGGEGACRLDAFLVRGVWTRETVAGCNWKPHAERETP